MGSRERTSLKAPAGEARIDPDLEPTLTILLSQPKLDCIEGACSQ